MVELFAVVAALRATGNRTIYKLSQQNLSWLYFDLYTYGGWWWGDV